eukprot:25750_1
MRRFQHTQGKVRVLTPGLHSLIVSYPGRIGYWRIGIPPSGPMDDYSFRIANKIINNPQNAAGLEITYKGPKLQFDHDTQIILTGAKIKHANINNIHDISNEWYKPIQLSTGDILDLSDTNIDNAIPGCRTYLSISNGGFIVNDYLGSKTSFPMGKFGGPNNDGAVLKENDILQYNYSQTQQYTFNLQNITNSEYFCTNENGLLTNQHVTAENQIIWEIGVLAGPQSSPDYLTENDVKLLYETEYEVSHNASRLGIRLNGTNSNKFSWARTDGGEGGSHPSNLIDNPYPIGSVNFTGDYPVILTVDGPSLGGFVCPITIPSTELWKVGQLKPSDKVRFKLLELKGVIKDKQLMNNNIDFRDNYDDERMLHEYNIYNEKRLEPVLFNIEENKLLNQPKVEYRLGGDKYLLIDYGYDEIDLNLRVRVHKLEEYVMNICKSGKLNGIIDTIPGVKTLLIEYDPLEISLQYLLNMLVDIEQNHLCDVMDLNKNEISLQSRIFNLPFVFNCEWTNLAIKRYMNEVRSKGAYLPSNTQFICNNNGLSGIDELEKLLYDISFLVLGLGDVYLGAPCAIPIDPRQRLNVPKYNPSRNFTPEGAVGIGGKFMCIYPMESPGGYQLIGRTLQIFNKMYANDKPWLLNMFDQVRFYPVTAQELIKQRDDNVNGALKFDVSDSEFNLNEYNTFIEDINVKNAVNKLRTNQKIYQERQLKYDKELLMQDEIALKDIIYENILWYQSQMIINGAKYGTSMYVYITENFDEMNEDIIINKENFIKPLNIIEGNELNMTMYNKLYNIKLHGIIKQCENKYDIRFHVNGCEYIINDIVFDECNVDYVSFEDYKNNQLDYVSIEDDINININVERIYSALPGKLVKLHVNVGDDVNIGDQIATISAMKMETPIHSHVKGNVVYINNEDILSAKAVIAHVAK